MLDFIAPAQSASTVVFYQKVWKLQALLRRGKTKLLVSPEVRKFFLRLKDKRVIVCPNHPMEEDGPILFALSAAVKQSFHFLAAREIFGHSRSKHAKVLQKLGCYSVQRGVADVHAFKCSCELLKKAPCKLVIFPEGEVSYRGSFMREFESGPELIALSALNEMKRSGCDEKVYLLPIALKYEFSRDQTPYLVTLMKKIERRLKLDNSALPFHNRVRAAYGKVLEQLECSFSITNADGLIENRLYQICDKRIAEWADKLGLSLPSQLNQIRKIHLLMNGIAARLYGQSSGKPPRSERKFFKQGYLELKQCISLMAVRECSFAAQLNQEDAIELLRSLTCFLFPGVKVKRPDLVLIGASQPIDVEAFLPSSPAERKDKIAQLKSELRNHISERLAGLSVLTIGDRRSPPASDWREMIGQT